MRLIVAQERLDREQKSLFVAQERLDREQKRLDDAQREAGQRAEEAG